MFQADRCPIHLRNMPAPPPRKGETNSTAAFDPVPLRARADGWTPERQACFIRALAETACVTDACKTVGLSERSAYALRARGDAASFRDAWEAAVEFGMRRLSDAVLSRAINGVVTPIFYKGEQVGERRTYDDRLAMFLMQRRDPLYYGRWRDSCDWKSNPNNAADMLAKTTAAIGREPARRGDSKGSVS
jgi:hypothetical protein